MRKNLLQKILESHLVSGEMRPGEEIAIRVDQTLTQDSLGAIAYMQYESFTNDSVKTELSVSYVDHLMMQSGEGNADVHRYLETIADNIGVYYSKPGNGICHQVHLERYCKPGKTLIGCDSHTVTCGAAGMAAFGVGGLDVALAMAGQPFYLIYPKILRVWLTGKLSPWVTAKDAILELLKSIRCKGNVGTALEYAGPGLQNLTIPQRATMANMGAESGITTSIFPSDEMTLNFLSQQNRPEDWVELLPDRDATYDGELVLDLSAIEPNVALPHSPDNVKHVREAGHLKVDQVLIGSCTNSSFQDLMNVAYILRKKKVAPWLELGIAPGSRQVLKELCKNGALGWLVSAGARILESGCGFCVGHGQAPQLGGVSVRTNNRNYKGRSGTQDAAVYLVSPETAAATALSGYLTDPRDLNMDMPQFSPLSLKSKNNNMILPPTHSQKIYRSKIIGTPPTNTPMPHQFHGRVAVKVGDSINTDDIIPAGPTMVYRANIQKSCDYIFQFMDPSFPKHCREITAHGEIPVIVAGESYGQGSSREHAALCPMALGVRCVIAKSIERIHQANLINFGILPLLFESPEDYEEIEPGNELLIGDFSSSIISHRILLQNSTRGKQYQLRNPTTEREQKILLHGGKLNFTREALARST